MIVNYTTFKSNAEFVKWQEETQIDLINVAPLVMEIELDTTEEEQNEKKVAESSGKITTGIFVTYTNKNSIN